MKNFTSSLVLFCTIFVLYAVYMWFILQNHVFTEVLTEGLLFSAAITLISRVLDVVKGRFNMH